ncbi:MAG: hypothetical protein HPY64_13310 [Anaerolineae bacterium]|nr:hypothetical protein [Anaerolineae bacterium]
MTSLPGRKSPDAICRAAYLFMLRETRLKGLSPAQVRRSAQELSEPAGGIMRVRDAACRPTGVALGCPLPDPRAARRWWRIARLVDGYLAALRPGDSPAFAYVPPALYHTTLLNYTHFDESAADAIHPLTPDEWQQTARAVAGLRPGPITLECQGLILTHSGRLLVTGFPADDSLYRLRAGIAAAVPGLRTHIPETVHLKLGHLLVLPPEGTLAGLLAFVARCGQHISARLTFTALHTPLGDIPLVGGSG